MASRLDEIRAQRIVGALTTCAICACFALETPTVNAAIVAGGGFDYVEGAGGQRTRSALAIIAAPLGSKVSATFAGIRFDDATVGSGSGVLTGWTIGVAPNTRLRAWGTRYFARDFSAWRVKAGPEVTFPAGAALGLFYAHDANNLDEVSDAAVAELGVPLAPSITGRASGSYAAARGVSRSLYGSLGLGWSPARNFEITGDIGRASNGVAAELTPSPRGGLPLLGDREVPATPSSSEPQAETMFQFGVRLLFP